MNVRTDGEINIEQHSRGLWTVTRPLSFWADSMMFTVPAGFVFDGGSIPSWLHWWSSPINGWSDTATGIHDYLYRHLAVLGLTRKFADDVFYAVMQQSAEAKGARQSKPWVKYRAVRMFGWLVSGAGDGTPPRKVRRAQRGL